MNQTLNLWVKLFLVVWFDLVNLFVSKVKIRLVRNWTGMIHHGLPQENAGTREAAFST